MRYLFLTLAFISSAALAGPGLDEEGDAVLGAARGHRAWWVMVGAFADPIQGPNSAAYAGELAARCGGRAYIARSDDFAGFTPGYLVAVVGPFERRRAADFVAARVRPCVPQAYVRGGTYAGP